MTNVMNSDFIFINDLNIIKNMKLKRQQKIKFNCELCGKETLLEYRCLKQKERLLCKSCQVSVSKSCKSDEYKKKVEEKRKQTCLKRFGKPTSFPEKISDSSYKQAAETRKKTNLEKYGCECCLGNKKIREKIKKTMDERYGGHSSKNEAVKEKQKNTFIERYGGYTLTNKELRQKVYNSRQAVFYNGIRFDSKWELIYYKYLEHKNIKFEYQPNPLYYYTDDGVKHKYYPDFLIDGEHYVEIKGGAFFNDKGEPFNKFTKSWWWEKYNCMLENNVEIITDIKPYII